MANIFSLSRPGHVITFVRPKPNQPPTHATFAVPLKFNKFDLRDYLFHVYNVEVRGVRSFINQMAPQRQNNGRGKWYRPQSQKMMVAELTNPFVWPEPPAETDREDFDYDQHQKVEKMKQDRIKEQKNRMKGEIPLRTQVAVPADRRELKKQAKELLESPNLWGETPSPMIKAKGGTVWTEVETEDHFDFDRPVEESSDKKDGER